METTGKIDPELVNMLRCPLTRSRLRLEGDFLVAEVGGLRYPVRDGIPVMLTEEAQLPPDVATLDEFKLKYRGADSLMPDRDSIPLDYGRPAPKRLRFRWLILLAVWSVGLVIWLLYLVVLGYVLLVIL